jgi:hypothetical protein
MTAIPIAFISAIKLEWQDCKMQHALYSVNSLPYLASCVPMANNPHSTTRPSQMAPSLVEPARLQVPQIIPSPLLLANRVDRLRGGQEFADKANVKREKDEQT